MLEKNLGKSAMAMQLSMYYIWTRLESTAKYIARRIVSIEKHEYLQMVQ